MDQKGEKVVKNVETNTIRTQIRSLLLGSVVFAILLINSQGAEQKDIAMQSQDKELSRSVIKHFFGIEAR